MSRKKFVHSLLLFAENSVLGLKIVRRITYDKGEELISQRKARYVVEEVDGEQRHVGYQLCQPELYRPEPVTVRRSNPAISRNEMLLNAGTAFSRGKSRTAHLSNDERGRRIHPLSHRLLPQEDAIERAVAKVNAFAGPVDNTRPDRSTTVYPSGLVTGQYRRKSA